MSSTPKLSAKVVLQNWVCGETPSEYLELPAIIQSAVSVLKKEALATYLNNNLDKFSNIDLFFQLCWDDELGSEVDNTFIGGTNPLWDVSVTSKYGKVHEGQSPPRFWAIFAYERWRARNIDYHPCLFFNSGDAENDYIKDKHLHAGFHRCFVCGGNHAILCRSLSDSTSTLCPKWNSMREEFNALYAEIYPVDVFKKLHGDTPTPNAILVIPTKQEFEIAFFPHVMRRACRRSGWFNPRLFANSWYKYRNLKTQIAEHDLTSPSMTSLNNNNEIGDNNCLHELNLTEDEKSRCKERYVEYIHQLVKQRDLRIDADRLRLVHEVELFATRENHLLLFCSNECCRNFFPSSTFLNHFVLPGIFYQNFEVELMRDLWKRDPNTSFEQPPGIPAVVKAFLPPPNDAAKTGSNPLKQSCLPAFLREVNAYRKIFKNELLCSAGSYNTTGRVKKSWYFIATRQQGGNLQDLLKAAENDSPLRRFSLARKAMQHLQSVHQSELEGNKLTFVHGDIKPANFVSKVTGQSSSPANDPELVLIDFEFSSVRQSGALFGSRLDPYFGMTPFWCSPAKQVGKTEIKTTVPDDVFSFAFVLYEIFHWRKEPRKADNEQVPQFWIDYFAELVEAVDDADQKMYLRHEGMRRLWEKEIAEKLFEPVPHSAAHSFVPPLIPHRCDPLLATLMRAIFLYYQEYHSLKTTITWLAVMKNLNDSEARSPYNPPSFAFTNNFLFYSPEDIAVLVGNLVTRLGQDNLSDGMNHLAESIRAKKSTNYKGRPLESHQKLPDGQVSLFDAIAVLGKEIADDSGNSGEIVCSYMADDPWVLADLQQCLYELEATKKYFFELALGLESTKNIIFFQLDETEC